MTTVSDKPLDIVLVLDTSGSMAEGFGDGESVYRPAYNITTSLIGGETYYAKVGDDYQRIEAERGGLFEGFEFKYWKLDGERVEPKTSEDDADPNHIQFYTYGQLTKLNALQDAAAGFIDATAEQNSQIVDPDKKHSVSIVSYASGSTVRQQLTACEGAAAQTMKNAVNRLSANGATYADDGMESAQSVLTGNDARSDAQKVVIFFTDGEPNHQNGFDGSVANDAIATAGALKASDTFVYTIGVMQGADPGDTRENFNAYMNGMSSNYPNAQSYTNLGQRAEGDYYKAATDVDELNTIFQEISQEIQQAATGSPTEVGGEDPAKSGYITFTDQLGDYMQVDDFKTIVYADNRFDNPTKTTSDDRSTDTYVFSGKVDGNNLYDEGDMLHLVITVVHGDGAAGDRVTVQIPAELIPLRNFQVSEKDGVMSMDVTEAYPIRVFYGVSLKDEAGQMLENPDEAMREYLTAYQAGDGKVAFYSNAYTAGEADGDTVSEFEPADTNDFYYFTADTLLLHEDGSPVSYGEEIRPYTVYKYERAFYVENSDGTVELKTSETKLVGESSHTILANSLKRGSDGNAYIEAGTPRLTRINDFTSTSKASNKTGTAENVINPTWAEGDEFIDFNHIDVRLGNNGKLAVEQPGTLAVTKTATVAGGYTGPADLADVDFAFDISIPNAANRELNAEVRNAEGAVVSDPDWKLAFDSQGKVSHSLKNGETLFVFGLSAGDSYTVAESADAMPDGFAQKSATGDAGTIAAGETAIASFANEYSAQATTVSGDAFQARKDINDWPAGASFEFRLTALAASAPLPQGLTGGTDDNGNAYVSKSVSDGAVFSFGDVEFSKPGQYAYLITERTPDEADRELGVSYSDAVYRIDVTVTDDGAGKLSAAYEMKNTYDTSGLPIADPPVISDNIAVITNQYHLDSTKIGPLGDKVYTDNGDNGLTMGMFSFKIKPLTANAPIPTDGAGDPLVQEGEYYYTTNAGDGSIAFGQIGFTQQHEGETYVYEISEDIPEAATADNGYTVAGMKYDPRVYYAHVSVSKETAAGGAAVKATIVYRESAELDSAIVDVPNNRMKFENSYTPDPAKLEGENAIQGQKTLSGRDWSNDEFEFALTAANEAAVDGLAADTVVFGGDAAAEQLTARATDASHDFGFGSIEFAEPGVYAFNVNEVGMPDDGSGGLTYDRHTATVTVTVTDDKQGHLQASVSYDNSRATTDADKVETGAAAFTNVYSASIDYGAAGGLNVSKILSGRDMKASEFGFTIEGADDASEAKLAQSDRSFGNGAARDGIASVMKKLSSLRFTQAEAGNTYAFIVDEADGAAADNGITYDKSQYRVAIEVFDDGDGTMHAVTTVKRAMTVDGQAADELIGTYNSDNSATEGSPLVEFGNAYAPESVEVDMSAHAKLYKILDGRAWLAEDSFSFDIEKASVDGATSGDAFDAMPSFDQPRVTLSGADFAGTESGESVEFGFGSVTFGKAGTYVYQVTEDKAGTVENGISYSSNIATVTIVIADPGDGHLVLERVRVGNDTFTNTYKSELNYPGAVDLAVTKTLDGHALEEDQFQFRVKGQGLPDEGIVFGNSAPDADGTATMKLPDTFLHFTQQDSGNTFVLEFAEMGADGQPGTGGEQGGYVYDATVHSVEITPIDNGNGTMSASTNVVTKKADGTTTEQAFEWKPGDADVAVTLPFANSYSAESVYDAAASIDATKTLAGRDMRADEFSFEVVTRAVDGAQGFTEQVAARGGNASADRGQPGSVTFASVDDAMIYDAEKLDAAVGSYATKEIVEGKQTWTLNYTARELVGTDDLPAGVTAVAGKTSFDFTVVVTDQNDGTLSVSVEYPDGAIAFENEYAATMPDDKKVATDALFSKVLDGRAWNDSDAFAFELTAVTPGAPMPDGQTGETTLEDLGGTEEGQAVPFGFGTIGFAADDMDGQETKDFVYEVTEVDPGEGNRIPGVTYSANKATLTVTVTDDGEGTLSAVAKVENATFINSYESSVDYSALGGLRISKTLNGRDMEKDLFSFTVKALDTQDGPTAAEAAEKLGIAEGGSTYKNGFAAQGDAFVIDLLGKGVEFTQEDDGKTYTYEVVEVNGGKLGYTYDDAPRTVTIAVSDNGDATLTVTTVVEKGGQEVDRQVVTTGEAVARPATVELVNEYNDVPVIVGQGGVAINAIKQLANHSLDGYQFSFNVIDAKGGIVTSGMSDPSGAINFNPVEYTTDRLNADVAAGLATETKDGTVYTYTYDYTVSEDTGSLPAGISGVATSFRIQVSVIDDGTGSLEAAVTYPADSGDQLVFENVYGTDGRASVDIAGGKTYKVESGDDAPSIVGEYTFEIESSDGAPLPAKTTANNDASGMVSFGEIVYTMENVFGETGSALASDGAAAQSAERSKAFTYTVRESGDVPGVSNDPEAAKTFSVTVTDHGDGTLSAEASRLPNGLNFEFVNTYSVDPLSFDASADIDARKVLEGRALNAGEFEFELVDGDTVVSLGKNDAEGAISFEPITYTEPGTYTYQVREKDNALSGIEYDKSVFAVTVVVEDNGDATMSADAMVDGGGEIVFENFYEAAPTSAALGASKVLEGRDLADGEFSFSLIDASGTVLEEASNDADGQIAFSPIAFDEAGTYRFTVEEVLPEDDDGALDGVQHDGVTYDDTSFGITVTVVDSGRGVLEASVAYDAGAPMFANVFSDAKPLPGPAPDSDGSAIVSTGDGALGIIGGLAALSATAVAVAGFALVRTRKNRGGLHR